MALGLADDAGLGRDVERRPRGRCRSRARSSRRRCRSRASASVVGVALAGRAEEREPRLLVAGEDVRLEPAALADRRRRTRAPLAASLTALVSTATARPRRGARSAPGSRRASRTRAPSPRRASRPSGVDAGAEPGDRGPPLELVADPAVVDVGDEQPRRVRADVDDRAPHVSEHARPGAASAGRRAPASRLSTASSAIRSRAARVAEPMCGTTIRFGASSSGSSARQRLGIGDVERGAGDLAGAQRVAAARAWSTIGPRAVLIRIAVGCIRASAAASIRWCVSGVSGQCSETKSERSSSVVERRRRSRPVLQHGHLEPATPGAPPPARSARTRRSRASRRGPPRPGTGRLPGQPVAGADRGDRLGQLARRGEQQREGEVGGGVGEHVRRVADRDAARRGGVEVDVVVADRVVGDRPQPRAALDQRRVDPVGEQRQQTLGVRRAGGSSSAAAAGARARRRPRDARAAGRARGREAGG